MSQSQSVAFSRIPANNLVPLFFVEFSNINGGVSINQQPTLLIGQSLKNPPGGYGVPAFIPSLSVAYQQFGQRSMLARKFHTYYNQDTEGPIWCLPLADATGAVAATGSIAVTGPATLPGTVPLYVAGINIPVGVNIGDTATVIGGNIQMAINNTLELPLHAANTTGTVALTAQHKGVQGNNIDVGIGYLGEELPSGVSIAITPMANGAIDPDMVQVGTAIGDAPYDLILHPYSGATQLAELTTIMNDSTGRWAWNRQDYGHAFTMQPGTASSLLTTGGTINDQHQTIIGVNGSPSPPWDWAADWGGAAAVSIKALASRPLQTLPLLTVMAPQQGNWWNYASQQALLSTGIAVPGFSSYGAPQIIRSVTTYQLNAYGVPDQSYLDVETMFTLMAITRQLKAALTTKFARCILVPDGTPAGPLGVYTSPSDVKLEIIAQYNLMQATGLVTSAAQMIAGTVVMINAANPSRCDILWTPALANGLRMFGVNNQFTLQGATLN